MDWAPRGAGCLEACAGSVGEAPGLAGAPGCSVPVGLPGVLGLPAAEDDSGRRLRCELTSAFANPNSDSSVCRVAGGSNHALTSLGGLISTMARPSLPRNFSSSSGVFASK